MYNLQRGKCGTITFWIVAIVSIWDAFGQYILEGAMFSTYKKYSQVAYGTQLFSIAVFVVNLLFEYVVVNKKSFWRRRWNVISVAVGQDLGFKVRIKVRIKVAED